MTNPTALLTTETVEDVEHTPELIEEHGAECARLAIGQGLISSFVEEPTADDYYDLVDAMGDGRSDLPQAGDLEWLEVELDREPTDDELDTFEAGYMRCLESMGDSLRLAEVNQGEISG